jgi:ABC-2 type transport system permease protein
MNGFSYWWGELIPGTWYLMARIDQTIRGTPVDLSLKPLMVLGIFVLTLAIVTALRLEVFRIRRQRRAARRLREVTP